MLGGALEVANVGACSEFAGPRVEFVNNGIVAASGPLTPKWLTRVFSLNPQCGWIVTANASHVVLDLEPPACRDTRCTDPPACYWCSCLDSCQSRATCDKACNNSK
jgi:hypothetical protein